MTNDLKDARGKDTVSDAHWARVMGEAPEGISVAADDGQQNKVDDLGATNGTDEAEDRYEVGYGKPPKHTQFKKGRSGNRKGRPKGTRNFKTDLVEELSERVKVTENGRTKKITKQRLMLKSLTAKAIKGDARAADILIKLVAQSVGLDPGSDKTPNLSAEDTAILDEFARREAEPDRG